MPETEPQAATSPEPQASPAVEEPSPAAPDAEAAAPSETTEPPGCLHTFSTPTCMHNTCLLYKHMFEPKDQTKGIPDLAF